MVSDRLFHSQVVIIEVPEHVFGPGLAQDVVIFDVMAEEKLERDDVLLDASRMVF